MTSGLWKTVWPFYKKLNTHLPYDLVIPLLGICPREKKAYVHEYSQQFYLPETETTEMVINR